MTSDGVLWVVEDRDLRALLKTGCAPAGLSCVRLLIEGDELIFEDTHSFAEVWSILADHAVAGDNCRRGACIANERGLAAMLHDHRDCERCSKTSIDCAIRFPIEVARQDQ